MTPELRAGLVASALVLVFVFAAGVLVGYLLGLAL